MTGQSQIDLPPLPPAPPSVASVIANANEPVAQSSPEATAAHLERIRDSVTGKGQSGRATRNEGINRGPLLTGIALALILVAAGIATLMIVPRLAPPDRSSPRATITGYFDALQQDDFSSAWQFVSASRNDTGSQSPFTQALHADDVRYGKVLSIQIVSVDTDGTNHATVVVQATRAADAHSPVVYAISLTQYDGTTWLIDSITNQ